jgi:hypothetical protein
MDPREIIETQKRLEQQDSVFRTNWQDTANYIFPRESNITDISYPGTKKTEKLYDVTAILESENMASGLLTNLVPAGQKFFSLTTVGYCKVLLGTGHRETARRVIFIQLHFDAGRDAAFPYHIRYGMFIRDVEPGSQFYRLGRFPLPSTGKL